MADDVAALISPDTPIILSKEPNGYEGLWGHSLNTRKAFYTNSPKTHPAATGLPDEHLPLYNFMSIPVIYGDKIFGQISLANADQEYTDEILKDVQSLADILLSDCIDIFSKKTSLCQK